MIYWIMLAATVALGIPLCREKAGKIGKAVYCSLMGIMFFAVSAIRYGVGYDYFSYANIYNELRAENFVTMAEKSHEKGFSIILKFFTDYIADYQIVFILAAAAVAILIMLYIYKSSSLPWISAASFLIFGLYFNSMNFMRQFIAAMIVMFAYRYITKKRFWRFAVAVLFASAFHASALIILPFYFLLRIKISRYSLPFMVGGGLLIFLFSDDIILFITKYFYSDYGAVANKEMWGGLPIGYAVGFTVFFVLALLMQKMLVAKNPYNAVRITAMFFAVLFEFIALKHGILSRLALYFVLSPTIMLGGDMFLIIKELIAKTFRENPQQKLAVWILTASIAISAGMGYYWYLLGNNYNGVLPYSTVFERGESD